MEGFEKFYIRIVKIILGLAAIFGFLALVFWFIFYSTYTVNTVFLIPLRYYFQTKIVPSSSPFQIKDFKYGSYLYVFTGRFEKMNLDNSIIWLKGSDDQTYSFLYSQSLTENDDPTILDLYANPDKQPDVQVSWFDPRLLTQILRDYKADPQKPVNLTSTNFYSIKKLP